MEKTAIKVDTCPRCESKKVSYGELLLFGKIKDFDTLNCNSCGKSFTISSDGTKCIGLII